MVLMLRDPADVLHTRPHCEPVSSRNRPAGNPRSAAGSRRRAGPAVIATRAVVRDWAGSLHAWVTLPQLNPTSNGARAERTRSSGTPCAKRVGTYVCAVYSDDCS
ncbi:hypothetical protein EDD99_7982 [Streptomyces sp. 846.5]|nr:hypothetical protein EDD99_7982 [Streptomyces sp. 846.5]